MTTKEKLLSLAKNSIVLDIAGEAEYVLGGTRFGGKPDVPEDFQWPYFGEGPDEDAAAEALEAFMKENL